MTSRGKRGSLSCVGLGMMLGAHLTPRARSTIEHADVVFVLASDGLVERWVERMHADVRSLQPYYTEGISRRTTYVQMVDAVLAEVRAGRKVCAAFYGHPGVFAQVAHEAIAAARAEGFDAVMEPGISAEDCLYADLGIDPGRLGCQHLEATQFLCTDRRIDTAGHLVLWQAAVVGDTGFTRRATGQPHRALLVAKLRRFYPAGHEVIVYEAPTIATAAPRIDRIALEALVDVRLEMHSTLVLGPALALQPDRETMTALEGIGRGDSVRECMPPRLVVVHGGRRPDMDA